MSETHFLNAEQMTRAVVNFGGDVERFTLAGRWFGESVDGLRSSLDEHTAALRDNTEAMREHTQVLRDLAKTKADARPDVDEHVDSILRALVADSSWLPLARHARHALTMHASGPRLVVFNTISALYSNEAIEVTEAEISDAVNALTPETRSYFGKLVARRIAEPRATIARAVTALHRGAL